MKKSALDRLLDSAARAPAPAVESLSWTREQQVLGEWRRSRDAGDVTGLEALFRKGLAFAGVASLVVVSVVMLASVTPDSAGPQSDLDVDALADEAITLAWNP